MTSTAQKMLPLPLPAPVQRNQATQKSLSSSKNGKFWQKKMPAIETSRKYPSKIKCKKNAGVRKCAKNVHFGVFLVLKNNTKHHILSNNKTLPGLTTSDDKQFFHPWCVIWEVFGLWSADQHPPQISASGCFFFISIPRICPSVHRPTSGTDDE